MHGGASMVSGYTTDSYATGHVVNRYQGKEHCIGSSVIGVERGVERLVSTTEHEGECIVHERYESQRVRVPKKIIREEVIERVYVVPETVQIEEYVEEDVDVEEKIVEVEKKIIIEKIVEVPEIEIVEKIIEIPETVVREKVREVPKIEYVERVVEVPVEQIVERCVSIPQIEYKDVPVEKIVEVPEVHTEEITREVAVPQYMERDVERIHYREEAFNLERKVPVPVEAEQIVEYTLPELIPRYSKKTFPVYLPRFIEVPIARQFAEQSMLGQAEAFNARVTSLTTIHPAMSLCEIENLAKEIKDVDLVQKHHGFSANIRVDQIQKAFQNGELMGGAAMGAAMAMGASSRGGYVGGIHSGNTATYTGGVSGGVHTGYVNTSRSYGGASHGVTHGISTHGVSATHGVAHGHTKTHGGISGSINVGGHQIGASIGRGGIKVHHR